jgi:hypothetical protein
MIHYIFFKIILTASVQGPLEASAFGARGQNIRSQSPNLRARAFESQLILNF